MCRFKSESASLQHRALARSLAAVDSRVVRHSVRTVLQDMASWTRDGISGLQSVVLYSLPELDGAIDTVPLGGLVNNDIFLVPERVQRLAARIKKWVDLRRTPPTVRTLHSATAERPSCNSPFARYSVIDVSDRGACRNGSSRSCSTASRPALARQEPPHC